MISWLFLKKEKRMEMNGKYNGQNFWLTHLFLMFLELDEKSKSIQWWLKSIFLSLILMWNNIYK